MPLKLLKGKSVLVIEDDVFVRSVLSVALIEEGYEVIEARTGKEALETLREQIPYAVMLDPALPDIDGFEISRMIRDEEEMAGVRVVVVAGREGMLNKLCGFLAGVRSLREEQSLVASIEEQVDIYAKQWEFAN